MGHTDASIEAFLNQFADCWKSNDASALAAYFVDDGTLINPFGQRADGRAAVSAMYREYFAGMLQGTTTTVTIQSIRAVGADHAFVDAEQPITAANGDTLLVAHLAALLERSGDSWRFADSRPYTTPPAPGPGR
jgi:uncharacterized protein (TIGR02246 family)